MSLEQGNGYQIAVNRFLSNDDSLIRESPQVIVDTGSATLGFPCIGCRHEVEQGELVHAQLNPLLPLASCYLQLARLH